MCKTEKTMLTCGSCGASFSLQELTDRASDYWYTPNVVVSSCPRCMTREELKLATGKVLRGCVHARGAPRFRTAERREAPIKVRRRPGELFVEWKDGHEVCIGTK